ncbi:hypothetical protein Btru_076395 [Bulinus truncatus]|nr:hypothetical protein Btru_076395 [Bulinus truncatus]
MLIFSFISYYVRQCPIMFLSALLCSSVSCYVPQCPVMFLSVLLCSSVPCYVPQCPVMFVSVLLCSSVSCYVPQCPVMFLSVLLCSSVPCYVPRCPIMFPSVLLCSSVSCYVPQCPVMFLSVLLCSSVPCYVPQCPVMFLSALLCSSVACYVRQCPVMFSDTEDHRAPGDISSDILWPCDLLAFLFVIFVTKIHGSAKMFSYLIILSYLTFSYPLEISNHVLSRVQNNVGYLRCLLKDSTSDTSLRQVNILIGKEIVARVDTVGNVEILRDHLEIDTKSFTDSDSGRIFFSLTIRCPTIALVSDFSCASSEQDGTQKEIVGSVLKENVQKLNNSEFQDFFITELRNLKQLINDVYINQEKYFKLIQQIESKKAEKDKLLDIESRMDSFIDKTKVTLLGSGNYHVENGRIKCDKNSDKREGMHSFKETPVIFSSSFSKTPRIWMGLSNANLSVSTRLYSDYKNVTRFGFVGVCGTWGNLSHTSWSRYDWIAFE